MRTTLSRIKNAVLNTFDLKESRLCRKCAQYSIMYEYKRLYFFHSRKTGGTSLNHIFLSLGGERAEDVYAKMSRKPNHRIISNDKVFIAWNRWLIQQGYYFYAFSHIPQHELHLPARTFTITCLRDPVERVISHYKMLLEFKKNNISHPCMKTEGKWLGTSFHDFLDTIPKKHLLNQLYMFSKKFDINEAENNILHCSQFFFMEQFNMGIAQLSSKIGIQLKPIKLRTTSIDIKINQKELQILRSQLDPEYELIERLRRKI